MSAKLKSKKAYIKAETITGEDCSFYMFEADQFEIFSSQLCKEQREICSRQVSGWPDKIMTESEIEEAVLNAPEPMNDIKPPVNKPE